MRRNFAICVTRILASRKLSTRSSRHLSAFNRPVYIQSRWKSSVVNAETTSGVEGLRRENITLRTQAGEDVQINAVIQDLVPNGPTKGTVIAIHGSPGSSHHFERLHPQLTNQNLRFISVNLPGYGITKDDPRLAHDGHERVELVVKIVEHLKLNQDLIFVGHSRGSETALRVGVKLKEQTKAILLVNPIGFITGKGVNPIWRLRSFAWLWDNVAATRPVLRTAAYCTFNYLAKVKADTSEVAVSSVRSIAKVDWAGQKAYVQQVNDNHIPVFVAHAGRDRYLEPKVAWNFLEAFDRVKNLTCEEESDEAVSEQVRQLIIAGEKQISVFFPKDGHHLQTYRAEFIANVVKWLMNNECDR